MSRTFLRQDLSTYPCIRPWNSLLDQTGLKLTRIHPLASASAMLVFKACATTLSPTRVIKSPFLLGGGFFLLELTLLPPFPLVKTHLLSQNCASASLRCKLKFINGVKSELLLLLQKRKERSELPGLVHDYLARHPALVPEHCESPWFTCGKSPCPNMEAR